MSYGFINFRRIRAGGKAACDFTCQPLSIHIYVWFKPPHRLQRRRMRGMRAKCRSILTAPAPVEILKLNMKLTEAPPPSATTFSTARRGAICVQDILDPANDKTLHRICTTSLRSWVPSKKFDDVHLNGPPSLSLIQISTSIEIAFISMHDSRSALSPQHSFFSISLREMEAIFLPSRVSQRN